MLLLRRAEDYLKVQPDILFAYLFGGLALGEPKPLSDVDIAVYLPSNSHFGIRVR
jgi:predicted nucleotidyltransferase